MFSKITKNQILKKNDNASTNQIEIRLTACVVNSQYLSKVSSTNVRLFFLYTTFCIFYSFLKMSARTQAHNFFFFIQVTTISGDSMREAYLRKAYNRWEHTGWESGPCSTTSVYTLCRKIASAVRSITLSLKHIRAVRRALLYNHPDRLLIHPIAANVIEFQINAVIYSPRRESVPRIHHRLAVRASINIIIRL